MLCFLHTGNTDTQQCLDCSNDVCATIGFHCTILEDSRNGLPT